MSPALVVKITTRDGRAIALSANKTSAMVADGAMTCDRCAVRLAWEFVVAAEQKGKKAPPRVVPGIQYTAEPRH